MIKIKKFSHVFVGVCYVMLYGVLLWVVAIQAYKWTSNVWLTIPIALTITFVRIPIKFLPFTVPWFLVLNWYFDGTIWIGKWGVWTWAYLVSWGLSEIIEERYKS